MRGRLACLLALAALPASASAAPEPAAAAATAATVTVRMYDFRNVLSRARVPVGTVRFVVVNRGPSPHDFAIAGKRTRMLKRGERQTLVVRFKRAGNYRYVCTVAGHAHLGMRGTLRVGRAPAPPPPATPQPAPRQLSLTKLGEFLLPTDIDAPPGDASRLVVVEQRGLVHMLVNGERRQTPFLDLRPAVGAGGEAGLLSIAFAPDYTTSGSVYAFYNDRGGNLRLVELRRSRSDAESIDAEPVRTLLYQQKFAPNHNGGMLQFGPDGVLYAAVGDGGVAATVPAGRYAQDPGSVFGKILRVDPASGAWTVWARGLRNPWKFWYDDVSGMTYIADVGQERREEINVIPSRATQINFGWPCFEGSLAFDETASCEQPVAPAYEYPHGADACSVTGGVVVRDARLPALDGSFLFGDLCGKTLSALSLGSRTAVTSLALELAGATTFGVDGAGRVHVGAADGSVYRIDPAP